MTMGKVKENHIVNFEIYDHGAFNVDGLPYPIKANPKTKVYLSDVNSYIPFYAKDGDSCADLHANTFLTDGEGVDTITVFPNERKLIKTGVHIGLPEGYEAQVRPRSGLAYKKGIHVHFGTIDNQYKGDVGVLLFNLSDEPFEIKNGDRIAQLAIVPISQHEFEEVQSVEDLGNTDRGQGGFGHTGV